MKKVNECEIYLHTPDGLSILFNYLEDKPYRIDKTLYLQRTGSGETIFLAEYESEKIAADVLTILIYDIDIDLRCVRHNPNIDTSPTHFGNYKFSTAKFHHTRNKTEIVTELPDPEYLNHEALEHMEYEAMVIRRGEKRDGESIWHE